MLSGIAFSLQPVKEYVRDTRMRFCCQSPKLGVVDSGADGSLVPQVSLDQLRVR